MVYLFRINTAVAIAYSLFVVGVTGAAGAISYLKNRLVDIRIAAVFSMPSIVTVFVTREHVVPVLPETTFRLNGFGLTKSLLMILLPFSYLATRMKVKKLKPFFG